MLGSIILDIHITEVQNTLVMESLIDVIFSNKYNIECIIAGLSRQNRCSVIHVSKMWRDCIMAYTARMPITEHDFYKACYEGDIVYLSIHTWPIQWLVHGFEDAYKGGNMIIIRRFLQLLTLPRDDGIPVLYRNTVSKWRKYVGLYDNDTCRMQNEMLDVMNNSLIYDTDREVKNIIIRDELEEFIQYCKCNDVSRWMSYEVYAVKHKSFRIFRYLFECKIMNMPVTTISNMKLLEKAEILNKMMNSSTSTKDFVQWKWLLTHVLAENPDKLVEYINAFAKGGYDMLDRGSLLPIRVRYPKINELIEPHDPLLLSEKIKYMAAGGVDYMKNIIERHAEHVNYVDIVGNSIRYSYDSDSIIYALSVYIQQNISVNDEVMFELPTMELNNHLSYNDMIAIISVYITYFTNVGEPETIACNLIDTVFKVKYIPSRGSHSDYQKYIDYTISFIAEHADDEVIWGEDTENTLMYSTNYVALIKLINSISSQNEYIKDISKELITSACYANHHELLSCIKNKIDNDRYRCNHCMGNIDDHFRMVRL